MKRLSISPISDELNNKMYKAIQELSPGSTYGKATVFVQFALEHLIESVEAGDKELVKALKQRLGARV